MDLLRQYLDLAVFGVLGAMSFLLVAFVVERVVFLTRVQLPDYTDRPSVEVALSRHLTAIASIASNAPYVGLLGTVLGILVTFYDLAQGERIATEPREGLLEALHRAVQRVQLVPELSRRRLRERRPEGPPGR